jgi:hypothetical protein
MNTQGTDIHVTKKMPLWPILENDDILHKECLFGRLRLQKQEKRIKKYEGFPAAIIATTGLPKKKYFFLNTTLRLS